MRAVVQRCREARVTVAGELISAIGPGLAVLLGVKHGDTEQEARQIIDKIAHLRIFADDEGKLNKDIYDIGGEMLLVSQFTLYADLSRGRRPAFTDAADFEAGRALYEYAGAYARELGLTVKPGQYGADMQLELCNDGPVTIIVEK
jgi:D-tyrosyl-tRNA(Tyr) deacylase